MAKPPNLTQAQWDHLAWSMKNESIKKKAKQVALPKFNAAPPKGKPAPMPTDGTDHWKENEGGYPHTPEEIKAIIAEVIAEPPGPAGPALITAPIEELDSVAGGVLSSLVISRTYTPGDMLVILLLAYVRLYFASAQVLANRKEIPAGTDMTLRPEFVWLLWESARLMADLHLDHVAIRNALNLLVAKK